NWQSALLSNSSNQSYKISDNIFSALPSQSLIPLTQSSVQSIQFPSQSLNPSAVQSVQFSSQSVNQPLINEERIDSHRYPTRSKNRKNENKICEDEQRQSDHRGQDGHGHNNNHSNCG